MIHTQLQEEPVELLNKERKKQKSLVDHLELIFSSKILSRSHIRDFVKNKDIVDECRNNSIYLFNDLNSPSGIQFLNELDNSTYKKIGKELNKTKNKIDVFARKLSIVIEKHPSVHHLKLEDILSDSSQKIVLNVALDLGLNNLGDLSFSQIQKLFHTKGVGLKRIVHTINAIEKVVLDTQKFH